MKTTQFATSLSLGAHLRVTLDDGSSLTIARSDRGDNLRLVDVAALFPQKEAQPLLDGPVAVRPAGTHKARRAHPRRGGRGAARGLYEIAPMAEAIRKANVPFLQGKLGTGDYTEEEVKASLLVLSGRYGVINKRVTTLNGLAKQVHARHYPEIGWSTIAKRARLLESWLANEHHIAPAKPPRTARA